MPKAILITGASSGIGEAAARRLASDGHHVALAARRIERLHTLTEEILDLGGSASAHSLDVTNRGEFARVARSVIAERGQLEVVINNAGAMPLSRLDALLVDEWDRMIDVNVRGLLNGIAATLPHFGQRGNGHFITVASIGAHEVSPTAAVYCGTKYAVWAITEGLRLESPPGIRVTTISPGVVESELAESISDPAARDGMRSYRANSIPGSAIASAISFAIDAPDDVDVNEIVVRPTRQR